MSADSLDLLVVGAGPTGIAIAAEARRAGLSALLVDRGALTNSILNFPTDMRFFTTREKMEIAGIPFTIADAKPDRRQALAYYRWVATHYRLALALHEEVSKVKRGEGGLVVHSRRWGEDLRRRAQAVALATGYFDGPRRLGADGEALAWVRHRYREPYGHYSQRVLVVGGGNSACEAALELWRAGAAVTLVHRGAAVSQSVKYWLRPDVENRITEGDITALFESRVAAFRPGGADVDTPSGRRWVDADAAYVLIGYRPDVELQHRCGVEVEPETLVPSFDPATCESNIEGLYIAGTLQAGARTDSIFIENSRHHGQLIVSHLLRRLRPRS